jgi:ABC-type uncharacterized transport system auxiliary subunit
MTLRTLSVACAALALGACGGLLETTIPAPQSYVLRLPARATPAADGKAGTLLLQRPEAGPGLDSDRIVLLRSDNRFDTYAASRWAAPAPDLLEASIVEGLRGGGAFSAVFDDSSPYAPRYDLRCAMRRFEADYTSEGGGSGSGGAPTIFVVLDCTLGRHRDRALLASFTAQGSAVARADRLNDVVAAFNAATLTAVTELERQAAAAVANEPTPAPATPTTPKTKPGRQKVDRPVPSIARYSQYVPCDGSA